MRSIRYLAQPIDVAALPKEFCLFRAGENASTKGSVWFDERSALLVMADAETYANDFAIDLEHRMVAPRLVDASDSDTDAMGWHRLAVRNGELWAVNVTWSSEGNRRLRSRLQRYTSPAFMTERDPDTGQDRVVRYINCALCSRPATHEIAPLVASQGTLDIRTPVAYAPAGMSKDRESMRAALAALDAGDATTAQSALRAALESPEEETPADEDEDDDDEAPAEPTDEEYTRARDGVIALAGDGVTDVYGALRTLSVRAFAATGAVDIAAAAQFVSGVIAERTQRQADERRALITELVTMKAETPATAWSGNAPVPRLADEPLDALRTRVTALRAARPAEVTPPVAGGLDALQDFERRDAAKIKDPEARSRFVASRIARKQKAQ